MHRVDNCPDDDFVLIDKFGNPTSLAHKGKTIQKFDLVAFD